MISFFEFGLIPQSSMLITTENPSAWSVCIFKLNLQGISKLACVVEETPTTCHGNPAFCGGSWEIFDYKFFLHSCQNSLPPHIAYVYSSSCPPLQCHFCPIVHCKNLEWSINWVVGLPVKTISLSVMIPWLWNPLLYLVLLQSSPSNCSCLPYRSIV